MSRPLNPGEPSPPITPMTPITRNEILARARTWAEKPRPYSQQRTDRVTGYRLDCSGYVSMAWALDPPGLDTVGLPDVGVRIQREALRPADVLLHGGPGTAGDVGHVMLFAGWAGPERSAVWVYEQVWPRTVFRVVPYPASPPYQPFAYRGLQPG